MTQAKLVVADDNPFRGRLQGEARHFGLRNVTFRGVVAPDYMSTCYDEVDVYFNAPNIDNMPESMLALELRTLGIGGDCVARALILLMSDARINRSQWGA